MTQESPGLRVAICLPCYDTVTRQTTISLAMMMLRIGLEPPEGLEWVGVEWRSSSNLSESRAVLASRAIKERQATHILWVDADMAFPESSLHGLLQRGVPIVGANYTRRNPPHEPTATTLDGEHLYTHPESEGLEAGSCIGFGLLLTEATVFEGLEAPWFTDWYQNGYVTEDVVWSERVRDAGHTIYIDHDLTKRVNHVGSYSFGWEIQSMTGKRHESEAREDSAKELQ